MASRTTLNATNLEAIGAPRLAQLVFEIVERDAVAKRRARLELFAALGTRQAAGFISKRLAAIKSAKTRLRKDQDAMMANELEGIRRFVSERIAGQEPEFGRDLALQLLQLAPQVIYRADEWPCRSEPVFQAAAEDLRDNAIAAKTDPEALAEHALGIILNDFRRIFVRLPTVLAPALGARGIKRLRSRLHTVKQNEASSICGYDVPEARLRSRTNLALINIADYQNDVDSLIALQGKAEIAVPFIAAVTAERFIDVDRPEDALKILDAADRDLFDINDGEIWWTDARVRALEALGRRDEAQDARLSCYRKRLSMRHLREYLKRLPDFEDVEAEARELDFAMNSADSYTLFELLMEWPDFDRAATLALNTHYDSLWVFFEDSHQLFAEFELRHPLATTLIYRSTIESYLRIGSQGRMKIAAKLLFDCERLAPSIKDFGEHPGHDEFLRILRTSASSRTKFWQIYEKMRKELT